MSINVKSKFKAHNTRKTTTIVVLLTVVLISSLLIIGIFMTNSNNPTSNDPYPDGPIHVKNEEELVRAINIAIKHTIIKLDNDITLTAALNISNGKDITLLSVNTDKIFKLIGGVNSYSTILVDGGVFNSFQNTFSIFDGEISNNTQTVRVEVCITMVLLCCRAIV